MLADTGTPSARNGSGNGAYVAWPPSSNSIRYRQYSVIWGHGLSPLPAGRVGPGSHSRRPQDPPEAPAAGAGRRGGTGHIYAAAWGERPGSRRALSPRKNYTYSILFQVMAAERRNPEVRDSHAWCPPHHRVPGADSLAQRCAHRASDVAVPGGRPAQGMPGEMTAGCKHSYRRRLELT